MDRVLREQWPFRRPADTSRELVRARPGLDEHAASSDLAPPLEAYFVQPVRWPPRSRAARRITHHELATHAEQWRRTLGDDGRRTEGSRRHQVERSSGQRITSDVLGAVRANDHPVTESQRFQCRDEWACPSLHPVEENPPRQGPRHGKHQPRQASARAQVERPHEPATAGEGLGGSVGHRPVVECDDGGPEPQGQVDVLVNQGRADDAQHLRPFEHPPQRGALLRVENRRREHVNRRAAPPPVGGALRPRSWS